MLNEQIFEAVCAEFNDNFFEDKWNELPRDSLSKNALRRAMRKALLKLWELRPSNQSTVREGKNNA